MPFPQVGPCRPASEASLADIHVVVLVLGLLLHQQLLQRGVDVQLVGFQLLQQSLSLQRKESPLLW